MRTDIALVVAQAYCDRAASTADRDEVAAYDSMEDALKLLINFSSAPRLQTEIGDALEVRGPLCIKGHKTVFMLAGAACRTLSEHPRFSKQCLVQAPE